MEKKQNNPDTSFLKKTLFNDPTANFRIKIENSKRQLEKARSEGNMKQNSINQSPSKFLL